MQAAEKYGVLGAKDYFGLSMAHYLPCSKAEKVFIRKQAANV